MLWCEFTTDRPGLHRCVRCGRIVRVATAAGRLVAACGPPRSPGPRPSAVGATLAALLSACGYSAANDCQCQAAAAALDGLPLTECWAHRRALAADLVAAWQRRTGRPARCRHHAAAVLLVVCAIAAAGLAVYWRGQR